MKRQRERENEERDRERERERERDKKTLEPTPKESKMTKGRYMYKMYVPGPVACRRL